MSALGLYVAGSSTVHRLPAGAKLTLLHLTRVDQVTSEFTESMKDVFTRQRARNEVDYED